ncbi:MAG: DUF2239 family protein [Gemmatimonadota bacterium]
MDVNRQVTAFDGPRCIATGNPGEVARTARLVLDRNPTASILVFDTVSSETIEIDFRGSANEVMARIDQSQTSAIEPTPLSNESRPRARGRPRLGVVAREVTLLPRHWEWLSHQPGGASIAIRKLVEEARRLHAPGDRLRQARESTYRFISVMAGDQPGFEEATRALFAGNHQRFNELIAAWPSDVAQHARRLAMACRDEEPTAS